MEKSDEKALIELLKTGKVKPDQVSAEGQTPLMIAIDNSFSLGCIDQLIELGCDVNAKDNDGYTPLHTSALLESEEMFKKLLSHGADPKIKDNEGVDVEELVKDGYKNLWEIINSSSHIATSLTASQFENQENDTRQSTLSG